MLRLQAQELRASLDVWQQALLELRLAAASPAGELPGTEPVQGTA